MGGGGGGGGVHQPGLGLPPGLPAALIVANSATRCRIQSSMFSKACYRVRMLRSAGVAAIAGLLIAAWISAPAFAAPPRRPRATGPATSLVGQIAPAVQAT